MGHQSYRYIKLKGAVYYFTRRVPKALQQYAFPQRIELCLHTSSISVAQKQADQLAKELDDHWAILRSRQRNEQLFRLFSGNSTPSKVDRSASNSHGGPLLSIAIETYLNLKGGVHRPQTFEASARRSVSYLFQAVGDKPVGSYSRQDANALRQYLLERGLARDSVSRNFTNVRAIINFAMKEDGLTISESFTGIYLGEAVETKKRYVPSTSEILKLANLCHDNDDDLRWILGILLDTGMRLSEVLGLSKSDVHLDADIPYLHVQPHPWRRLKTSSSKRSIPLVGRSLWAARRALSASTSTEVFPRYLRDGVLLSNSASACLNKWIKANVNEDMVIHSMRHAMRDRLRNVECPPDVIDAIGGWARDGVGEGYGRGHSLTTLHKWLEKTI